MADDIPGIDDFLGKQALVHPRRPTEFDAHRYLQVDTCGCIRASGHDHVCLCAHGMERIVYRIDDDGREHYETVPRR